MILNGKLNFALLSRLNVSDNSTQPILDSDSCMQVESNSISALETGDGHGCQTDTGSVASIDVHGAHSAEHGVGKADIEEINEIKVKLLSKKLRL